MAIVEYLINGISRRMSEMRKMAAFPPVSVSGDGLDKSLANASMLRIIEGFLERVGGTRRLLLSEGLRARLADTLIAPRGIDLNVALVALVASFGDCHRFERWHGLRLVG